MQSRLALAHVFARPMGIFAGCFGRLFLLLMADVCLPSAAASLDVFLTATPERIAPWGYFELGSDHMNASLDVLNVRDSDPLTAGTKAGDYHGAYISGAVRLGDGKWLSGGLWQRTLSSTSDSFGYTGWQLSGLYRFLEPQGKLPAMAVRLSTWSNYADATESTTAVVVPGARLNTVKITNPADRQIQADLIGTWDLTSDSYVSASLGMGRSQLSYGVMSATTTRNGCDYQLAFDGNSMLGTLMHPCEVAGGVILQFSDSSGLYGVDIPSEIAWRGSFVQTGINGTWQRGAWTYQAGYLLYVVQREAVDRILSSRDKPSYTRNQNITLQATYRLQSHVSLFARGQLTSNMLLNDIPVTYNSSTAERFGSKYTLFTLGLRADF